MSQLSGKRKKRGRQQNEGEFEERNKLNVDPMMNHVILTRLFEVCELSDIFNFRLVCKEWYSLSLTRLRKEVTVNFGQPKKYTRRGYGMEWGQGRFGKILDVRDRPFRKFHVSEFEFMSPPYPTSPPVNSMYDGNASRCPDREGVDKVFIRMCKKMGLFWGKYGSQIHNLKISVSEILSMTAFKKVIFEELPNLEQLELDRITTNEFEEVAIEKDKKAVGMQLKLKSLIVDELPPTITWSSVFLHFPNIQKVIVKPLYSSNEEVTRLVDALESSRSNLSIKDLGVGAGEEETIDKLLKLPLLKLETLCLNAATCEHTSSVFETVMERHGSTLKKLEMFINFGMKDYINPHPGTPIAPCVHFPYRPEPFLSLTEFRLGGYACPNFHFLEQLPNLKVLILERCYPKMEHETVFQRMEMMVRLPHLYHLEVDLSLSAEAIEMLGKVMPNVEILKTSLTTSAFRVVCQQWKNLRQLHLRSLLVFGMNDVSKEEIIEDETLTGMVVGCDDSDMRYPNITDLQHLQQLFISSGGKISDASIWNGFLKLPNLRSLYVTLAIETSDEALNALMAHVPGFSGSRISLLT